MLIDYGPVGDSTRFEAWTADPAAPAMSAWGLLHIERRVEAALAELFDGHSHRSHVLCVFGPHGAGKSTLLGRLARCARLQGFVPFAVDLLDSSLAAVVDGRSVFLLDDQPDAQRSRGSRALADLAVRSARRHVIVRTSLEDARGVPSIGLARLPAADLIASVVSVEPEPHARVRRAARRADGNPGRFISLIRGVRCRTEEDVRDSHFKSRRARAGLWIRQFVDSRRVAGAR